MKSTAAPFLLSLGLLAPAVAQEEFRRETVDDRPFDYTDEYFLDLLTYLPPEDWHPEWDAARTGYRLSVGSVRTDEFYLDQRAKASWDFWKWFHGRASFQQMEDYDSRFVRITTGGDFDITDRITAGAFTTLLPEKNDIDVGYSLGYVVDRSDYILVTWTDVDSLFNRKGVGDEKLSGSPNTLAVTGGLRPVEAVEVELRVGRNFPLRLRNETEGLEFVHRKTFWQGRLEARLSPWWTLVLRLEGESTDRQRTYDDPANLLHLDQERDATRARAALARRLPRGFAAQGGLDFFYLYEASDYLANPGESRILHRREYTLFGEVTIPVPFTDHFFLRPALYLTLFDDREEFPSSPGRSREVDGLKGKISPAIEYRLEGRFRFYLNPTFRVDRLEFGGGHVAVQATF